MEQHQGLSSGSGSGGSSNSNNNRRVHPFDLPCFLCLCCGEPYRAEEFVPYVPSKVAKLHDEQPPKKFKNDFKWPIQSASCEHSVCNDCLDVVRATRYWHTRLAKIDAENRVDCYDPSCRAMGAYLLCPNERMAFSINRTACAALGVFYEYEQAWKQVLMEQGRQQNNTTNKDDGVQQQGQFKVGDLDMGDSGDVDGCVGWTTERSHGDNSNQADQDGRKQRAPSSSSLSTLPSSSVDAKKPAANCKREDSRETDDSTKMEVVDRAKMRATVNSDNLTEARAAAYPEAQQYPPSLFAAFPQEQSANYQTPSSLPQTRPSETVILCCTPARMMSVPPEARRLRPNMHPYRRKPAPPAAAAPRNEDTNNENDDDNDAGKRRGSIHNDDDGKCNATKSGVSCIDLTYDSKETEHSSPNDEPHAEADAAAGAAAKPQEAAAIHNSDNLQSKAEPAADDKDDEGTQQQQEAEAQEYRPPSPRQLHRRPIYRVVRVLHRGHEFRAYLLDVEGDLARVRFLHNDQCLVVMRNCLKLLSDQPDTCSK